MNVEPVYKVAIQQMPAVQQVSFWKSQVPNLINLLAAVGALGAAVAAWKAALVSKHSLQIMVKNAEREEELKSPIMEVIEFSVYAYRDNPNDDYRPFSIRASLHNILEIPLRHIRYNFFVLDQKKNIVSQFNNMKIPKDAHLGTRQYTVTTLNEGNLSTFMFIAVKVEATDIRGRNSGTQTLHYMITFLGIEPTPEKVYTIRAAQMTEPQINQSIDVIVAKWIEDHKGDEDNPYLPFKDERIGS